MIKRMIIAVLLVILTAVGTFWFTMSNLYIQVNEAENGALVECFGQVWYHPTEEIGA